MPTMTAMRLHAYGDALKADEIDTPAPGQNQVLVKVHAASINPVDWKVRDGMLREKIVLPLPLTLGGDFSGTVAADGGGFKAGEEVFGMTDTVSGYASGAFGEYVAVSAANLARKPSNVDHVTATAVPLAGLTAWQAVHDRGQVAAGQRVLVHAAAGGVGSFAVQFLKAAGAQVIATASATNAAYVTGLGADQVIDYRTTKFEDVVRDIDLVVDLMGEDIQDRSYGVLKHGGRLVNAWGALNTALADRVGVDAVKVAVSPNGEQLAGIADLIEKGRVTVTIAKVLPLMAVNQALDENRQGHTRGKIVLQMP
jgi:NADPH:quinone reductase-like Zn-dependent oxidoreductase